MIAILRIEKCKSLAAIGSRAAHNIRLNQAAPHADPSKRPDNKHLFGGVDFDEIMQLARTRLDSAGTYRKDAVRGIEVMLSASPEFFDPVKRDLPKWRNWRDSSVRWLQNTFSADNIVSAELHLDESTPHIHAIVIPVHAGKLRASNWLDGPVKLAKLQDSYAAQVQHLGLKRGERGSKARHIDLRKFYKLAAEIAEDVEKLKKLVAYPTLPKRDVLGRVSADEWKKLESALKSFGAEVLNLRAIASAGQHIGHSDVGQEIARRTEAARKRAKEAEKQLKEMQIKLQAADDSLARKNAELKAVDIEIQAMAAERQRLAEETQHKRDALGLGELEAEHDALVSELQKLREQRSRY